MTHVAFPIVHFLIFDLSADFSYDKVKFSFSEFIQPGAISMWGPVQLSIWLIS